MTLAIGTEVYNADAPPVTARGVSYTEAELDTALRGSVSRILWDDAGTADLQSLLGGLSGTGFSGKNVTSLLSNPPVLQNWRVGEGLAEAFLTEHRDCEFPWPSGRDLKNPSASPAGSDLVGFQKTDTSTDSHRFAFGEVKTSEEDKWPPRVVQGLHKQIGRLRDERSVKEALIVYLGHRAQGTVWLGNYQNAFTHYLANPDDVSIFGVLVRDVEPKKKDLEKCAGSLSSSIPSETTVELRAMYLPKGSIDNLAERVVRAREGGHGQD